MASPLRASLCLCLGLAAFTLAAQTKPGVDPANIDTTVKPCDNFYQFANGGWLKSHSIPADKARFGAFEEVNERNRAILQKILDETSAKTAWTKGSIQQKVGDFYASGMNEPAIEKRGLAPLRPIFATIDGLKDTKQLPTLLAKLHGQGLPGGFGFFVGVDGGGQSVFFAHPPGQPFECGHEAGVVQDGRAQLDREHSGRLDGLIEEFVDLVGGL